LIMRVNMRRARLSRKARIGYYGKLCYRPFVAD
jgi:hypothetical protein